MGTRPAGGVREPPLWPGQLFPMTASRPLAITGVRVVDLVAPFTIGGSLAVAGDHGSGVNVVAMEVMQNLCRRYHATAICHVTVDGTFNESNVRGWVDKLQVGPVVASIEVAESACIDVIGAEGVVARLLPFAVDHQAADAWVVVRNTVVASGRLPGSSCTKAVPSTWPTTPASWPSASPARSSKGTMPWPDISPSRSLSLNLGHRLLV